jgi:hypothetical protein
MLLRDDKMASFTPTPSYALPISDRGNPESGEKYSKFKKIRYRSQSYDSQIYNYSASFAVGWSNIFKVEDNIWFRRV